MSKGRTNKNNNLNVIWLVLGLAALGTGLGAAIASRLVSYRPSSVSIAANEELLQDVNTANTNDPRAFCRYNALDSVTASLYQVRAMNAIANDPLPTISNLGSKINTDLLASLNPAPFPQISDRARTAKVPIIMYHDIAPVPDVSWDVTTEELERHFQALQDGGYTPISMDQLVNHLRTGASLPDKPVLLTFDDNYIGQYKYAFPLLKQYNYPAVWSVHTRFVGTGGKKPKATWEQLREMQASGLITIASHTVNHLNLKDLDAAQIAKEVTESKKVLEKELQVPIHYFTYPEGDFTSVAREQILKAGYKAALSMSLDPTQERVANESEDLITIMRFGQSRFDEAIALATSGETAIDDTLMPVVDNGVIDFTAPVRKRNVTIDGLPLTLVSGGKVVTAHADTRAQVAEIVNMVPNAIAAVDGTFFSLESLDSNAMIGPIISQFSSKAGEFIIGRRGENPLLNGRPLVLMSPTGIKFIPFNAAKHISKESLQAELPDVTDAFVGAGWLVRDGKAQPAESFGKLYGFDAHRDRAFWGIDRSGRPVIGVTMEMIDSVGLGKILVKAGMREVVMLDSGASAALAYRGKSVMAYEPRPTPHIVALLPPDPVATPSADKNNCPVNVSAN